jgi:hypothetical protein
VTAGASSTHVGHAEANAVTPRSACTGTTGGEGLRLFQTVSRVSLAA